MQKRGYKRDDEIGSILRQQVHFIPSLLLARNVVSSRPALYELVPFVQSHFCGMISFKLDVRELVQQNICRCISRLSRLDNLLYQLEGSKDFLIVTKTSMLATYIHRNYQISFIAKKSLFSHVKP